jgi:invasion protein IalB
MTRTLPGLGVAALVAVAAGAAPAQETTDNRVAASTDWSVFQESDPVECFSVSAPTSQENTRDGESVEVQRGDALLFVFYRPSEGVSGQVTFTGGYPFAANLPVTLEVGDSTFQLFTEGEWAWPASPEEDARLVAAMKAGAEAVVTGQSGRGTVTRDTFSLQGFTAAVEEAQSRCAT